jgi:hypothetical protein
MKAPKARHEKDGAQSMICVVCLFGVLVSAMSLGSLRLYGLYLEHRLAYVTMRIEAVDDTNSSLEERYSSMLSPSRIYNYAKSELKMVTANEIETIRLSGGASQGVTLVELTPEELTKIEAAGGLMKLFIGTAHAQD